jgi:hypothetical protein
MGRACASGELMRPESDQRCRTKSSRRLGPIRVSPAATGDIRQGIAEKRFVQMLDSPNGPCPWLRRTLAPSAEPAAVGHRLAERSRLGCTFSLEAEEYGAPARLDVHQLTLARWLRQTMRSPPR